MSIEQTKPQNNSPSTFIPDTLANQTVCGDAVAGDKVGQDKVGRDKIEIVDKRTVNLIIVQAKEGEPEGKPPLKEWLERTIIIGSLAQLIFG